MNNYWYCNAWLQDESGFTGTILCVITDFNYIYLCNTYILINWQAMCPPSNFLVRDHCRNRWWSRWWSHDRDLGRDHSVWGRCFNHAWCAITGSSREVCHIASHVCTQPYRHGSVTRPMETSGSCNQGKIVHLVFQQLTYTLLCILLLLLCSANT